MLSITPQVWRSRWRSGAVTTIAQRSVAPAWHSTPPSPAHAGAAAPRTGRRTARPRAAAFRAMPVFLVASAAETGPAAAAPGQPQWRIAVGNLLAGATAGCAVEAGAHPHAGPATRQRPRAPLSVRRQSRPGSA